MIKIAGLCGTLSIILYMKRRTERAERKVMHGTPPVDYCVEAFWKCMALMCGPRMKRYT